MTPVAVLPPQQLTGYVWPLADARVSQPFGPSPWGEMVVNGQSFHDGLDITTACGDRVLAAHDGVVLAAGRVYDDYVGWVGDVAPYYDWLNRHGYWNSLPIVVVIDDGDGYRSIYAHEAWVSVVPGQAVKAGDMIGSEGMTGNATGCHVHFGLFSPFEARTFALDPGIVERDSLPPLEIARIDPLLVLPFRCDVEEQVALRPAEASACPPPTKRPVVPTKKPAAPTPSAKSTPSVSAPPASAAPTAAPTTAASSAH